MPSPFPGMNPYLEHPDRWRAVHNSFLVFLQSAVIRLVAPRYAVEYEESLYVDESRDGDDRLFAVADVAVSRRDRRRTSGPAAAVAPAPVTLVLPEVVRKRERWLTIRDSRDRAVVTVIEVLSPSNKEPGADRERYLRKRQRVLRSPAHLIEIDLLRAGERSPVPGLPACDYCVLLSRRPERPRVGAWPLGLRDALPAVPIPLRPGEPEPAVDLKAVLDRVYDEGGYELKIYDRDPVPPLSPGDADWARGLLPAG